jgi:hypothetical protein
VPGRRTIFANGTINWDESAIRIMLSGPTGMVSEEVQRRARAVQKRAQYRAPFRTGRLRYSISVNTRYPSEGAIAEIEAKAPYSLYVEFGRKAIDLTGSKHYLNWQGFGGEVFTQTAAAVPATHFMRDALDAAEG